MRLDGKVQTDGNMKLTDQKKLKSLRINPQQYKLMTAAGFHVDAFSWQLPVAANDTLIYWKRGEIKIVIMRYERLTIKKLADRLIRQVYYMSMRMARERMILPDADKPCFKYDNDTPL